MIEDLIELYKDNITYFRVQKKEITSEKIKLFEDKDLTDEEFEMLNKSYKSILEYIKKFKMINKSFKLKKLEKLKIENDNNINYMKALIFINKISKTKKLFKEKFKEMREYFMELKNNIHDKKKEICIHIINSINGFNKNKPNENISIKQEKSDTDLLNIKRNREINNNSTENDDSLTEDQFKEALNIFSLIE